jgi:LEA14-like dessication related protein
MNSTHHLISVKPSSDSTGNVEMKAETEKQHRHWMSLMSAFINAGQRATISVHLKRTLTDHTPEVFVVFLEKTGSCGQAMGPI